eukprot:gene9179-11252_t
MIFPLNQNLSSLSLVDGSLFVHIPLKSGPSTSNNPQQPNNTKTYSKIQNYLSIEEEETWLKNQEEVELNYSHYLMNFDPQIKHIGTDLNQNDTTTNNKDGNIKSNNNTVQLEIARDAVQENDQEEEDDQDDNNTLRVARNNNPSLIGVHSDDDDDEEIDYMNNNIIEVDGDDIEYNDDDDDEEFNNLHFNRDQLKRIAERQQLQNDEFSEELVNHHVDYDDDDISDFQIQREIFPTRFLNFNQHNNNNNSPGNLRFQQQQNNSFKSNNNNNSKLNSSSISLDISQEISDIEQGNTTSSSNNHSVEMEYNDMETTINSHINQSFNNNNNSISMDYDDDNEN